MTGSEIVTEIVTILGSGISGLGTALGGGVNNYVTSLAFVGTGENQALSIFFIAILCFAGVSLSISLTRRLFDWLASLGNN